MKKAPYKIGTHLKHKKTGITMKLVRYRTQRGMLMYQSQRGGNSKIIPNYKYIYGKNIENGSNVKGLTKDFEPIN